MAAYGNGQWLFGWDRQRQAVAPWVEFSRSGQEVGQNFKATIAYGAGQFEPLRAAAKRNNWAARKHFLT